MLTFISYLLDFAQLRYQVRSTGHPVRIELTNNVLFIKWANHYILWDALRAYIHKSKWMIK